MKTNILGLLTVGLLVGPVVVQAVPITLTFTGTDASYSLDDQQHTGDFSVVFHADTSNVGTLGGQSTVPGYEGLTGTISLSSVGVGTFESAFVFNNQVNEVVGFGVPGGDLYDLIATGQGLATYELTTNFSPISTTSIVALEQWDNLSTTLGSLTVFSVREGTFQATSVLEPGSLALLGVGLLGLGVVRRRAG